MDFENTLKDLFKLFTDAESGVFLLVACVITILVQIIKNTCINKLQIDLKNKFDPTVLLPFFLGILYAILDFFVIKQKTFCGLDCIVDMLVDGLSVGATSVMIYRIFSVFDGTNLKTLCKDGVFSILYHELLIVTQVRKQLLNNEISYLEFLEKLKEAESGIKALYAVESEQKSEPLEEDEQAKVACIKALLAGLVDAEEAEKVAKTLHDAYKNYFEVKGKK